MKKLYTSVVIAAMSLMSVAQAVDLPAPTEFASHQKKTKRTEITMPTENKGSRSALRRKDGPKKAQTTIDNFAGQYVWLNYNLIEDNGWEFNTALAYVDNATTNTIALDLGTVSSQLGLKMVKAIVDIENRTMTIPNNQFLGIDPDDGSEQYFYLKQISEDGSKLFNKGADCKETVGTIAGGVITFPETDVFAIGTPDNEQIGWYVLSSNNQLGIEDLDMGWEDYCDATFIDGWMTVGAVDTGYINPEEHPYKVKVQKYEDSDSRYRIIDPYSCDTYPYRDYFKAQTGYIIFDISAPDFVMVEPGIANGIKFNGFTLCNVNLEGFYYYYYGGMFTTEEIKESLLKKDPEIEFSYIEGNKIYFNNCRFTTDNELTVWDQGAIPYMKGSLVLDRTPGEDNNAVETVSADNTPVEFYNLQGMRVDSDVKGLVIRHQGSKTEKIYVR